MKNPSRLKVSAYSSLAISFLSLSNSIQGQVFHTDVEPDYLFTETETPPQFGALVVDLNADSNPEMVFAFTSFEFTDACFRAGSMSFYFANYASVMVYNDASSIQRVQIVNAGEEIGAGGVWNNNFLQSLMFSDFFSDTCLPDAGTPFINGNWTNADNKYIGVRFLDASSNLHYGWVRLSVILNAVPGDAELTLLEIDKYAFELQSNIAIIAGNEGEPLNISEAEISTIQISPNPATDYIQFQFSEHNFGEIQISIRDINSSQVVHTEVLSGENTQLNISHLPSGMYVITLQSAGKLSYGKFIKL